MDVYVSVNNKNIWVEIIAYRPSLNLEHNTRRKQNGIDQLLEAKRYCMEFTY